MQHLSHPDLHPHTQGDGQEHSFFETTRHFESAQWLYAEFNMHTNKHG